MKVTIKISDEQGSNGKTTLYCQDLVKKFLSKNRELFPEEQWKFLGIDEDVQESLSWKDKFLDLKNEFEFFKATELNHQEEIEKWKARFEVAKNKVQELEELHRKREKRLAANACRISHLEKVENHFQEENLNLETTLEVLKGLCKSKEIMTKKAILALIEHYHPQL